MHAVGEDVSGFVRQACFGQVDVRRLAGMMRGFEAADAEELVWTLIEERHCEQAAAVVVAAHVAGCAVSVAVLEPLLAYPFGVLGKYMALVRAVEGDLIDALMELWKSGRIDNQIELAFAYYIGRRCEEPPPEAVSQLRLMCRMTFNEATMSALGEVVRLYDDPELNKLGERHVELAKAHPQKHLFERMVIRPPLELLPERAARQVVIGRTVQRSGDEVGRNDPCPCESGRKYKKCCLRNGSRGGGKRPAVARKLTDDQFQALPPHEIIALDLDELNEARVVMAFETLVRFGWFDEAARVLGYMDERGVEEIVEHRGRMVERALFAGELDVVRHQTQFMDEEAAAQVEFDLLLGEEGVTVAELAEAALRVLRQEGGDELPDQADLAVALLRRHPPLGILVARGAMSGEDAKDADMLAQMVEEARDKLRLPAGDRASQIRDFWAEERMESELRDLLQRIETARQRKEAAEAEELRRKYAEARREREDFKAQLAKLQRQLERAEQPADKAPAHPAEPANPEETQHQVARLRQKIERLKGIIDEKNERQSALREQVSQLHERIEASEADGPHDSVDTAEAAFDALDAAEPDASCAVCMLPRFDAAFESAMGRLPSSVVRRAVESATELATADTAHWTDVKRLRTADVYTRRVGRHWRMFFRIEPEQASLVVLEVVSRQDFERALLRYRG